MTFFTLDANRRRLTLTLHVQPNAARTRAVGPHGDALKIQVAAPAADNKANAELIDFLHRWFKVPKAQIAIKRGAHGRRKIVEIDNPGPDANALLENLH
jgi:uncharacterized protein (TIGR00251 family)